MTPDLIVTLSAVFMLIALVSGWGVSALLSARAPERRRLQQLATAGGPELSLGTLSLVDNIDPRLKRIPPPPKSPKEMNAPATAGNRRLPLD